jgi:LPXTG-motif cell wall-anchored protein
MRRLVTALLVAAATVALGPSARAASVAPIPIPPGTQTCDTIAARFGVAPGIWREIRFTDPTAQSLATGTHTKSARGNTVTITITAEGTVDFVSVMPIEAVYVNKGNGPTSANAIYRYVPPVLSDTDLGLRPVVLSGVDHVVLCWTGRIVPSTTTTTVPSTTAAPTTTPPVAPTVPATSAPTTVVVRPTAIVPSTTVVVRPTAIVPSTTAAPITELPATGDATSTWVSLAALLALAGSVAWLVAWRRPSRT